MTHNKNRAEYEQRVNRVIDYVRAHRADELSVEALARVAAFSPFHFHRVFKAMTGENLIEFVQRTRLEGAASQLVLRPHADILEIALDHGFNSASAFARAFKERFGVTATDWRAQSALPGSKCRQMESKLGQLDGKLGAASPSWLPHDPQRSSEFAERTLEDLMTVTIKTLPDYHLAYMRHTGPYGAAGGIPALWQKLQRWAVARDLWTAERVCLGITLDDPMVTEPAKCRYDAAIVIARDLDAGGAVNVTDIPGGKYATVPFVGSSRDIARPWHEVFTWFPQSGYQPEHRAGFELYTGEAWDGKTDQFRCEVCVAVRPL